ncbi:ATP-binding cassette domain-containing protein [Kaistia geumhonensis]|uniref:Simple sugar transport system ATP-binding protein n=1 Tax=Kaistia geumhonensis TaxID=410839 RepID=A0ABU0M9Y8_9HYPH|nr:ATP-binding cassette domain-containing protein [Kaistia geumhonensis]MCX5480510.1 ATP-binding cassette domain-containing protein [Kaistia geumhonensis]MDQ0517790.1 simple sugar transport system ATP-binding protein [Kaistia geumhonensis]
MPALMTLQSVSRSFGNNLALDDVSLEAYPGEVHCLLGDNGAGKSTLIKIMSGVTPPSSGTLTFDGRPVAFRSPRDAKAYGIGTVHQDVGSIPLISVARNFFLGNEPTKGWGPFRRLDHATANRIALEQIREMGIRRINDAGQLVGTMSGGERQALAIARALYFGARLLILDEPTAALGVKESKIVIDLMIKARAQGIALVFITHNATHALQVGDRFTVLIQGRIASQFRRGEKTREEVLNLMAGGEEFDAIGHGD